MKADKYLLGLLTLGVFAILNTEMGVMGILPHIAEEYKVSLPTAGLLMSGFALVVALAGPTMPLLFSKMERKRTMLIALGMFTVCGWISVFSPTFTILLLSRILPAFFHPVYVSMAFSMAATSAAKGESQKSVAKVFIGVSAGNLLGIPISNFLANYYSLRAAFLFFALVNTLIFIASLILVKKQPAPEVLSYGKQLAVLKRSNVWLAIMTVILLNGATLGFSSYITAYLTSVSQIEANLVSLTLLGFGIFNILGNELAGRLLSKYANPTIAVLPRAVLFAFIGLFFFGEIRPVLFLLLIILGVLFGLSGNVNQYMISQSAKDAPDFANGLFLSSANIGVTVGTSICGYFIGQSNQIIRSIIGSCLLLVIAIFFIILQFRPKKRTA